MAYRVRKVGSYRRGLMRRYRMKPKIVRVRRVYRRRRY